MTVPSVRVSEIFFSLQGESSRVGLPTVFIRLTGCPLRCSWCDTEYAFTGGETKPIAEVVAEAGRHGTRTVCVTGGEPLAQKNCLPLLAALCDAGFDVSLETSGALDIGSVDPRVSRIMDLKAPGSGESDKNLWTNLARLTARDEVKIVVADRADYEWARGVIAEHRLTERCPVLLSPVQGRLAPSDLADWILADRLPVRFQLQLHKVLWGNMRAK
ncbi:MAG: 7-carboxy-7-deazaguanine synthase QueE [Rhodocyclales bacterium]|nr:7-carboxy-7-deazaguanine synthase QueE [Rhodocyclales bacterium]